MAPQRTPLPVDDVLPDLIDSLRHCSSVALRAPPGSGKTTRVPPAILDSGVAGGGAILMLEPRRVAARAAARRIADERNVPVGGEVGYQVRFDQKISRQTRLKIVTDGVLVRLLQADPYLDGIDVVIFDEFHERGLNADLALGMVRRLQQTVRPDLKIVVMSATLEEDAVCRFLDPCPLIKCEGTLFPVDLIYQPSPGRQPLHELAAAGVGAVLPRTAGDILVFLPGVGEIRRTAEQLGEFSRRHGLLVMQLYGDLPSEQQDAVLNRADRRRVVLSTNVAETSVTIEGVTAVVDTGLARIMRFDPAVGLDRLELTRIARASADQRAGRAGRTSSGVCLRLWSEREQQGLAAHEVPEIRRVDLAGPILQLHCWGEPDAAKFPWIEPPPESAIALARKLLFDLGAIDGSGATDLGRALVRFPVHPRIARLLVEGRRFGVSDRLALAAALLSERSPFLRESPPAGGRHGGQLARHRSESDLLDRMAALDDFQQSGTRDADAGRIDPGAARFILQSRDQLVSLLDGNDGQPRGRGTPPSPGAEFVPALPHGLTPDESVRRSLLAAFPDRVARRREPGSRRGVIVGGRGVRLWEKSAVLDAELFVCCDIEAGTSEALVRQASAIERQWLPSEGLTTADDCAFDTERERVVAVRRTCWNGLLLDETALALPEDDQVVPILAAAAAERLDRVMPLESAEFSGFLARVRSLRAWMPELNLPAFDTPEIQANLPTLCAGCRSFADLRQAPWLQFLKGLLAPVQRQALDREAPERLTVPSGSQIALHYEEGRPPVLAVRIQELFGLAETPRIAARRVPVVLHLLGPNYRPQQITDDLRSFWDNTYPQVRKDLRRRYPKHAWPEDPWNAAPPRRPRPRK